jgi:hypothetical protein
MRVEAMETMGLEGINQPMVKRLKEHLVKSGLLMNKPTMEATQEGIDQVNEPTTDLNNL